MDNGQNIDIGSVFGKLLADPDALKNALSIATSLKNSGVLDGILQTNGVFEEKNGSPLHVKSTEEEKRTKEEQKEEEREAYGKREKTYNESEQKEERGSRDGESKEKEEKSEQRKRLLLALRPYMSEERQDKIDLMLRILQLIELAGQLGLAELVGNR